MPRRSTALTRYLRETAMSVSRNVQDLFGTTEAAVVTQPDPTPNHEGVPSHDDRAHPTPPSSADNRLSPRGRRGRD